MTLTAERLAARRQLITATKVAPILGLSPFAGALETYLDMLGALPDRQNEAMRWGNRLQEVVRIAFEDTTSLKTVAVDRLDVHPETTWAGASCDALVEDMEAPLELKTARLPDGWGIEDGSDEVPDYYALQLQWQMFVIGAKFGFLAVLIGGSDFRWFRLDRNDGIIATLLKICGDFRERVLRRDPPAPDWTDPRVPELIELLHRPQEGVAVDADPETVEDVAILDDIDERLALLRKEVRDGEAIRDQGRARIINRTGAASVIRLPDGRQIVRKIVNRRGYEVQPCEYPTFKIQRAKRDNPSRNGSPEE